MQKSKNVTISFIIVLLLYGLGSSFSTTSQINTIYLYIINPLFWIGIAILLRCLLRKNNRKKEIKKRNKGI